MTSEQAEQIARTVINYLGDQTYQDQPLLHAIVCCDFVSHERIVAALAKEILRSQSLRVRAE